MSKTTHIICLIDKSGSMQSYRSEAMMGFNRFLVEQKDLPGKALITIALFNDRGQIICSGVDIAETPYLHGGNYDPDGGTALYDATGDAITLYEKSISSESGDKVLVVVLTDGEDTSSSKYRLNTIGDLIAKKRAQGWEFLLIGPERVAFAIGKHWHLPKESIISITADAKGMLKAGQSMSTFITDQRSRR